MFELVDVSKRYDQTTALQNIHFSTNAGEILGIVGKSGSGKSTLLRLLNLLETPTTGDVLLDGVSVQAMSKKQKQQAKQKIGVVFQHYNLLHNLTVLENVDLPLKLLGTSNQDKAQELLAFVGLAHKATMYPAQLSGGEKQRVAIARALIRDPQILLCDESTSSLDEENTEEVVRLLQKVHRELQPTIFFVSHELETVKLLCTRVLVLEHGQLIGELTNTPDMSALAPLPYLDKVKRSLER